MCKETEKQTFTQANFEQFEQCLAAETAELANYFAQDRFVKIDPQFGYELEGWLIDEQGRPAAQNQAFLDALDHPLIVRELSQFNFEINGRVRPLDFKLLSELESGISDLWQQCAQQAAEQNLAVMMCGVLPSLLNDDLSLQTISNSNRYLALNRKLLAMRNGLPFQFNIKGERDHFITQEPHVMLEAATTSLQLHMQTNAQQAVRVYNALLIACGPVLALCGNSPYVFGHDLWAETRIPLFKQSIDVGDMGDRPLNYVSFGHSYLQDSLFELFAENQLHYPVLLPECMDEPVGKLAHLQMHNGTVWRWNRPVIGQSDAGLTLRIENRMLPAGPTIIDMVANAAFLLGLTQALAQANKPPEQTFNFYLAENNFYSAARLGLQAPMNWLPGRGRPVKANAASILQNYCLPMAREGLQSLQLCSSDIDRYFDVLESRLASQQTGAAWQRAWVKKHGSDMQQLTLAMHRQQQHAKPVHQWSV